MFQGAVFITPLGFMNYKLKPLHLLSFHFLLSLKY